MKRKTNAVEDDINPPKRGRVDDLDEKTAPAQLDSDYSENDEYNDNEEIALTPMTPMSSMSPGRAKFPSDLKTIKCPWPGCDKSFNRPARLNGHLRSHKKERIFKCTYPDCDKDFLEEKHLKQHIMGSHTQERPYVCTKPGCGKGFLNSTRLRRHQLVHDGQERFRCRDHPPCNESFRKHNTLQRHIRKEHLNLPAYSCTHDGCASGFDTPNSLKHHIEREHGEIKFWCEECGTDDGHRVGFATLELLKKHMHRDHIMCMFCDRIFSSRDDMESHIEVQHSNLSLDERRTVACTWPGCTKSFVKEANMKAHIRTIHEGQRFVCGEFDHTATEDLAGWLRSEGCGDSYTTKANLENHVRYVHLGIPRPQPVRNQASCDMLGQLTSTSDASRRTILCSWLGCPLKFAQQADLDAHLPCHFGQDVGQDLGDLTLGPNDTAFGLPLPFEGPPIVPGLADDFEYPAPDGLEALELFRDAGREWQQDEAEMREFMEPNDLADFIDPALEQVEEQNDEKTA
ncbi:hypothetical protein BJ170DRAFT_351285 [Xylariales sp. AK1849]|nr:hypothetical protein BJ170DRAFT_351285 [Xylariales sp. AK1849]